MKAYRRSLLCLFLLAPLSAHLFASDRTMAQTVPTLKPLLQKAKQENNSQRLYNKAREQGFQLTKKELEELKAELTHYKAELSAANEVLAKRFSDNEDKLTRLEEKLRLETGSLGEVFGVVRQNAKNLQKELNSSVTAVDAQTQRQVVDDIVKATELPSLKQLNGFWQAFIEQIDASGQVRQVQVPFVDGLGVSQEINAYRLGAYALVGENGYLKWMSDQANTQLYLTQPDKTPTFAQLTATTPKLLALALDPSRGEILAQLALAPTWKDRLESGGIVGGIILALLAIGLLIAFIRGGILLHARTQIAKQLKRPQQPTDNPLGRVLSVYNKDKIHSAEALELRLLEVVVDEQATLEKGLAMLKLLAALAPMLGLLGTVTGMIETFQVITQFGNSDPKVMAGGISMALVTTVLGLVAAMPLLLAHNMLSTQAEAIRNILEKQGIGLVAEQAERDLAGKTKASDPDHE